MVTEAKIVRLLLHTPNLSFFAVLVGTGFSVLEYPSSYEVAVMYELPTGLRFQPETRAADFPVELPEGQAVFL